MTISGIKAKHYIWRCVIHIPIGIVASWMLMLGEFACIIAGLLFYYGFMHYELNEDFCIKDYAYPDIAGSLWGMFLYMLYWWLQNGT